MIERLKQGEFRESVISAKVNELVDKVNALTLAANNHYHMTVDCTTQGTGDIEKGFRSSSPRLDTGDDTEPDN